MPTFIIGIFLLFLQLCGNCDIILRGEGFSRGFTKTSFQ